MSTPPDELPASGDQAVKPPPRKKPSEDGTGAGDGTGSVASAADAPAPPRRSRSGATPAAVTAALFSDDPSTPPPANGPGAPAAAPPAKDKPAGRRAKAPKAPKTDPPPAAASSTETAPPAPDAPKPPRRGDASTAATSEADAEAALVDEPPKPRSRRLRLPARSATATVDSAPPSAAQPVFIPPPVATPTGTTRAVVGGLDRQYRQTVTKVDLWSVTKLSLCFYLSAMFVTIVALVSLWFIAVSVGIIHSVEKFLGDLLSAKNFHFLSATVLRGAILVGLVIVALQVVITVISASFYNIFAELFGGVEITVREEGPAEYPDPSLGL
jgi:hypothetical protein